MDIKTKSFKTVFNNLKDNYDYEILSSATYDDFERTKVNKNGIYKGQLIKLTNLKTGEFMKFGFTCNINTKSEEQNLEYFMSSLIQECQGVFLCGNLFNHWCDNYGYDNDSIKHLKIFKKIVRTNKNLIRVLDIDYYEFIWSEV